MDLMGSLKLFRSSSVVMQNTFINRDLPDIGLYSPSYVKQP